MTANISFDSATIISYLEGCSFQEWEEETNEEKLGWLVSATDNGRWPDSQEVEDMAKEFPSQTLATINQWVADERKEYDSPEAKAEREREAYNDRLTYAREMAWNCQSFNDYMGY